VPTPRSRALKAISTAPPQNSLAPNPYPFFRPKMGSKNSQIPQLTRFSTNLLSCHKSLTFNTFPL
jgi:hypothetical protein